MKIDGNIFQKIPDSSNEEIFEILSKNENVKIERIISYGQSSEPDKWYNQDNAEWVLLLKGSATLQFENNELIFLNRGDFLLIPPHEKHRIASTDKTQPTIWLAIHF